MLTRFLPIVLIMLASASVFAQELQSGSAQRYEFDCVPVVAAIAISAPTVSFKQNDNGLDILIDGKSIAEYVWRDEQIFRPYFQHLRTLSGIQVTRNHPPLNGEDLEDHATMHPGLWLAMGDLNGADFWRNKAHVKHDRLVGDPTSGPGSGNFTVRNVYESNGNTICTEDCQISIEVRDDAYLLKWRSTFRSDQNAFAFGDQEEMGLGLRVATPLAVVKGGRITDSEGRQNEPQVWGKQADWCDCGGTLEGQKVGIVMMPHPKNFRRCWFHARDYGLLVANPFGQNAFTRGEKSSSIVEQGTDFQVAFGVLVYNVAADAAFDIPAEYRAYVEE